MQRYIKALKLFSVCLFVFGGASLSVLNAAGGPARAAAAVPPDTVFRPRIPRGIPAGLWRELVPANNPVTAEKVALGEALYFDKLLSTDGTLSCATCHDPATAFADNKMVAVGAGGRLGARNAPTILNAAFDDLLFWDGRAASLEEQVKHPLLNPSEMGMESDEEVVARVSAVPDYRRRFRQVFKHEGITIETIAKAIATFERTQLSGNSPFDRYVAGNENAINEAQKRGWNLFKGKAQCITCHTFNSASPFFSDFKFHNTGVALKNNDFDQLLKSAQRKQAADSLDAQTLNMLAHAGASSELGRYLVTGRPTDTGAFKTPTLRDVELTPPYMHNGSVKTLLDVVRLYNEGGDANPYADADIRPLGLTEQDMNDLVEFMRALTSDDVLRLAQTLRPQTRSTFPVRHPTSQAR